MTTLCLIGVLMSDGSQFRGSLAENGKFTGVSDGALQLDRALTSADAGLTNVLVTATQNGGKVSSALSLTIAVKVTQPPPTSSLSPDGSKITGNPDGGSVGGLTLKTAYGVFEMGAFMAPQDGTHVGPFCMPMLNGIQCNPKGSAGAFGAPWLMEMRVDYGGNLFGAGHDQIWMRFGGYHWSDNYGKLPNYDYWSGPGLEPPMTPLPTYAPPYTPSPENSSISGGTGSLVTSDGKWEFGTAGDGGWRVKLNGIEVQDNGGSFLYFDRMTVYSHGRMFLHRSDGWDFWAMFQRNPSTGPTASPVPINMTVTPSRPSVNVGTPVGTVVCSIASATSDGSAFTGTYELSDTSLFKVVGSQVLVSTSPDSRNFYNITLSAKQNGATLQTIVNFGVS